MWPGADVKWVVLGCILADVPWIAQRVVSALFNGVDPYHLRLYAAAQSSLALTIVLSAALALVSAAPVRVVAILASGSLIHLLLDACEIKWGNGVHLFAPWSWTLVNYGFVWPEHTLIAALSLVGLIYGLWALLRAPAHRVGLDFSSPARLAAALGLAVLYLLAPVAVLSDLAAADSHGVRTLLERSQRTGRALGLDRVPIAAAPAGLEVTTLADERLRVRVSPDLDPARAAGVREELERAARSGSISLQARFARPDTLDVTAAHAHQGWLRDGASVAGLALVLALWLRGLPRRR